MEERIRVDSGLATMKTSEKLSCQNYYMHSFF